MYQNHSHIFVEGKPICGLKEFFHKTYKFAGDCKKCHYIKKQKELETMILKQE